jgi:hypothetical protein
MVAKDIEKVIGEATAGRKTKERIRKRRRFSPRVTNA